MTTPWEYKVVKFPDQSLDEDALNLVGISGWELVSIDTQTGTAFFKRPWNSNQPPWRSES